MQLDPHILLLDEPTAALDRAAAALVETLVATWLQELPRTRATLWVSHDQQQAARVADRRLRMDAGRLTE